MNENPSDVPTIEMLASYLIIPKSTLDKLAMHSGGGKK